MIYKFYDTEALKTCYIKEENVKTIISSITAEEIKPFTIPADWEIVKFHPKLLKPLLNKGFSEDITNLKNLACAIYYDCTQHPDETIFITNDSYTADVANLFFGEDSIQLV
jgi:hypothetical protein